MMLRFTLFLLLVTSFPILMNGQDTIPDAYRDCSNAYNLVDQVTALEDLPELVIAPLTEAGEFDSVFTECTANIDEFGFNAQYASLENKSFWFSFHVSMAGTFEMLVTPENLEGDFDFMIWEEFCPSNKCAEPIFCGWGGAVQNDDFTTYFQTGLTSDADILDTRIDQLNAGGLPEVWEAIDLKENTNYFVLIDLKQTVEGNSKDLGCTIDFGGTSVIGPTVADPELDILDPDTSAIVQVCVNTSRVFEVDLLDVANRFQPDYKWTFPSDARIREASADSANVEVFFGEESGEVCVELECPIQIQICWPVNIQLPADIDVKIPNPEPCGLLSIDDYVTDLNDPNNLLSSFDIFGSRNDALIQSDPLPLSIVNTSGVYFVTKKNGVCTPIIESFTAISTTPSLIVQEDTVFSCTLPYDLNQIAVDEANGFLATGNLDISFHKTLAEAEADSNPILDLVADEYGTYYIKGQTADDCKDILAIELIDATPTFQPIQPIQVCDEVDVSSFRPVLMDGTPVNFDNFFPSQPAAEDGSSPLSSPIITATQIVWGRAEIAAGCPGVVPIDITINKTTIDQIDPTSFCGASYTLDDLALPTTNTYTYYGLEQHARDQFLPIDEVSTTSTIWVRGESNATGCTDIIPVEVIAGDPVINPISPIAGCGSPFDLFSDQVPLSEANNIGLSYTFYNSDTDAEAGTNPIANGIINDGGTYYVRGETTGSVVCYDVEIININLATPSAQLPSAQRLDNGEFDLSNARIFDLVTLERLTNLTFFADSLLAANGTPELPSSVVTTVGTYWIRGEINGCPVIVPQEILAESVATLTLPDLPVLALPCTGNCVDLAEAISEDDISVNDPNLDIYFFGSLEEADDGLLEDTLQNLSICDPGFVYIRGVAANGEFGITTLQIGGQEVIAGTLMTMDEEICPANADQISLEFELVGTAPFEIIYTRNGIDSTVNSTSNTLVVDVNPTETTTYILERVIDAKNCLGTTDGSTTITLLEEVTIENLLETCNDLQTGYTLSFNIATGDFSSLNVDDKGTFSGTLIGNRYVSDLIPIDDNYEFSISDGNGCKAFEENGSVTCQCITEAVTLDKTPINACIDKPIMVTETESGFLSPTDQKFFVIHTSNSDQLIDVVAVQEEENFTYTDLESQGFNLDFGTTYYLSTVITKLDDQGAPILDPAINPCMGVARGVPIKFYDIPEVTISLEKETACIDEEVNLLFETNSDALYNVSILGTEFLNFDIENGDTRRVSASATTDFVVEYIEIIGVEGGCIDASRSDSVTLAIFEPIGFENLERTCDEGGREFTISFTITGGDPSSYIVDGSVGGTVMGDVFTSDPIMHKSNYRFDIMDANNCQPTTIQDFYECPCTADITTTISQILPISCPEDNDAAVEITAQNGLPPYSFQWQDGSTATRLLNLSKGMVYVSMTDANGCEVTDSFFVEGPDAIVPEIIINPPSCFGDENGSIIIRKVNGGTKPFDFYFNSSTPSTSQLYGNLFAQEYPFGIIDANGCEYRDTLLLEDPDPLTVSLLNNPKKLNLGDSIEIDTRVSDDGVSLDWSTNTPLSCMDCLNPITKPTDTGIYGITVTNEFGCTASDDLVIQVLNDKSYYAPTVFSPNGDGINDTFGLFGGSQVANINSLQIFNRWGARLYNRTGLGQQVALADGWDGMETNGDKAPSGIYLFVAEIVFTDGSVEVVTGDVALMR